MGNWRGVMPVLADRYRVIAVDMLGFGRTAKPADPFVFSQAARTDHLAGFLDALGLSNVALVGNSMGGASALGVAVEPSDANFVLAHPRDASGLRDLLAGLGIGVRGFEGRPGLEDTLRITVPSRAADLERLTAALRRLYLITSKTGTVSVRETCPGPKTRFPPVVV